MAVSLPVNNKEAIYQHTTACGESVVCAYECDGHDHDWVIRAKALAEGNPVEFCANCRRTKSEVIAQTLKHKLP